MVKIFHNFQRCTKVLQDFPRCREVLQNLPFARSHCPLTSFHKNKIAVQRYSHIFCIAKQKEFGKRSLSEQQKCHTELSRSSKSLNSNMKNAPQHNQRFRDSNKVPTKLSWAEIPEGSLKQSKFLLILDIHSFRTRSYRIFQDNFTQLETK